MSLLQPELSTPHRPSTGCRIAGPALLAGAALVLVGAGAALGTQRTSGPIADPCAVPGGAKLADLETHDARLVTRRLLACNDLRFGRITGDEYRSAIAAIDKQWNPEPAARPAIVWASTVRGFSTQYGTGSWSAAQALGAPDVWPGHGDNAKAWASRNADDRDEWLELGFDRAGRISAVNVYETFNPGAVGRVELITASGTTIVAHRGSIAGPMGPAMKTTATVSCTAEPIIAVRVHVSSINVPGWNEIDAVGVVPCGGQ